MPPRWWNLQQKLLVLLCRCADNSTYRVSPAEATPGPDKKEEEEEETVWKHLDLQPWSSDDITVECVTMNRLGVSRDVFVLCEYEN